MFQWQGSQQEATFQGRGTTIVQGIQRRAAADGWNVVVNVGFTASGRAGDFDQSIMAAASADYTVVVLGERPYAEMLNNIGDLALADGFGGFVAALKQAAGSKPVVLIMILGRQRTIPAGFASADAVLYGYLPGPEAGTPIARVLFGDANPSGRLPFDYVGQTGQRHLQYGSFAHVPLYEFGHGLSYTTFNLSDLRAATRNGSFTLTSPNSQYLAVSVTISNSGSRRGKEVVFLQLTELFSDAPAPQRLQMTKRFIKLQLDPGESRRITFRLNGSDFRYSIPAPGVTIQLNITAKIGSNTKGVLTEPLNFSTTLAASAWPAHLPENMPENLTRPSSFVAPEQAPPVGDSPFLAAPMQAPRAPPPRIEVPAAPQISPISPKVGPPARREEITPVNKPISPGPTSGQIQLVRSAVACGGTTAIVILFAL